MALAAPAIDVKSLHAKIGELTLSPELDPERPRPLVGMTPNRSHGMAMWFTSASKVSIKCCVLISAATAYARMASRSPCRRRCDC
jgi:hypothetical protein